MGEFAELQSGLLDGLLEQGTFDKLRVIKKSPPLKEGLGVVDISLFQPPLGKGGF